MLGLNNMSACCENNRNRLEVSQKYRLHIKMNHCSCSLLQCISSARGLLDLWELRNAFDQNMDVKVDCRLTSRDSKDLPDLCLPHWRRSIMSLARLLFSHINIYKPDLRETHYYLNLLKEWPLKLQTGCLSKCFNGCHTSESSSLSKWLRKIYNDNRPWSVLSRMKKTRHSTCLSWGRDNH